MYNFGTCGSTPLKLIEPALSECAAIQYQDCENEWEKAAAAGIVLPDCEMHFEARDSSCPYIEVNKRGKKFSFLLHQKTDVFVL